MRGVYAFTTENYPRQPATTSLFVNSGDLPVLMDTKSDINKDFSFAKMSQSSVTVEVLIEYTIFALILFIFFFVGGQGYTMFLLVLLID